MFHSLVSRDFNSFNSRNPPILHHHNDSLDVGREAESTMLP
jgi:hypothetical protein